MAAIKRFFEKRKLNVKFKLAGDGHKLTDNTKSTAPGASQSGQPAPRTTGPSDETRSAAAAALNRMQQPTRPGTGKGGSSLRTQVSQEMQAERKAAAQAQAIAERYSAPTEVELEGSPLLAVTGVYYKCPLVGPVVLGREEMEAHINQFLLSQLPEEPQMTSALMVHTLNKEPDKVKVCMETIGKYLDNISANPTEEKFRKIRLANKAFQERILPMQGSQEFLQAAGFQMKSLPGPTGVNEDFYVMAEEFASNPDQLKELKEILLTAEPIRPELDHNLKVFYPSQHPGHMRVPEIFYSVSADEIKREQQLRQEAVETMGMLRTKEMRQRERQRELRRYRFTLIRVRFPDGILLQGTFRARDELKVLQEFVRETLTLDWVPFHLVTTTGQRLTDDASTLAELDLAPAAVVIFEFDKSVLSEITAAQGSAKIDRYLKDEHLQNLEYVS